MPSARGSRMRLKTSPWFCRELERSSYTWGFCELIYTGTPCIIERTSSPTMRPSSHRSSLPSFLALAIVLSLSTSASAVLPRLAPLTPIPTSTIVATRTVPPRTTAIACPQYLWCPPCPTGLTLTGSVQPDGCTYPCHCAGPTKTTSTPCAATPCTTCRSGSTQITFTQSNGCLNTCSCVPVSTTSFTGPPKSSTSSPCYATPCTTCSSGSTKSHFTDQYGCLNTCSCVPASTQ